MKKQFTQLLKSETKKAEKAANEFLGCDNCRVTGYGVTKRDDLGFIEVDCEMCHGYDGERANVDVTVFVFMPDRRRSFARAI